MKLSIKSLIAGTVLSLALVGCSDSSDNGEGSKTPKSQVQRYDVLKIVENVHGGTGSLGFNIYYKSDKDTIKTIDHDNQEVTFKLVDTEIPYIEIDEEDHSYSDDIVIYASQDYILNKMSGTIK
ncbi:hypothetical protein CEW46_29270, partial [Bacillus cereus]